MSGKCLLIFMESPDTDDCTRVTRCLEKHAKIIRECPDPLTGDIVGSLSPILHTAPPEEKLMVWQRRRLPQLFREYVIIDDEPGRKPMFHWLRVMSFQNFKDEIENLRT
jgi:hypothetical protein